VFPVCPIFLYVVIILIKYCNVSTFRVIFIIYITKATEGFFIMPNLLMLYISLINRTKKIPKLYLK